MNEISCDVAIIGAGTAGLAAEQAARETGVKTLLIDDRFAGTTCATVGCMPSKLLLAAANAAHHVRKSCLVSGRLHLPLTARQSWTGCAKSAMTSSRTYDNQGRAKIDACAAGLVRIYADGASGAITGALLLGPAMDHIAHLFAWAIERKETASRMLELPFYHPTLEEGLKQPLREISELIVARETAARPALFTTVV
jgi:pyruvate/2-oxoglutarate dehydrogenase complex dihydrolipoamide dehydrogenase (E3) component